MRYQIGTARSERSVLSAMDIQWEELFANVGQSVNYLILNRRKDLESKRGDVSRAGGGIQRFQKEALRVRPKAR